MRPYTSKQVLTNTERKFSLRPLAHILLDVILVSALLCVVSPRPAYAATVVLPPAQFDGCVVEISPAGYLRGTSIQNDGRSAGNDLHLFHLGTTSKMRLSWDSHNSAYVIYTYKTYHEDELLDYVWDVEGQSTSAGAKVHVWSRHSPSASKATSQNWLFLPQTDGMYWIQNVRSGFYVSLSNTASGSDSDGNKLVLSATPLKWNLEILDPLEKASGNSSYFDMVDWMKYIPNTTALTMISMPGTHDTGTAKAYGSDNPQASLTQCQKLYIYEQLAVGVRFFDLRLGIDFIDDRDPAIFHGDFICYNKDGSFLRLSHVMKMFYDFLDEHPSETLVVLASAANSSADEKNITLSIEKYLSASPDRFWDKEDIPTLGDVRGKIVMLHRYVVTGNTLDRTLFGLDLSAWSSFTNDFKNEGKAVKIYNLKGIEVWVQDYFDTNATTKIGYVTATLAQADTVLKENVYLLNYTSCTSSNPFSAARDMNRNLATKDPFAKATKKPIGIIVMDYIDANWSRKIVELNFGGPVPAVSLPKTVHLVYGQTLAEAQLDGGFSRLNGIFSFSDPLFMPRVADSGTIPLQFSLLALANSSSTGIDPTGRGSTDLDPTGSILLDSLITLIVSPRPIEVKWSGGDSLEVGNQVEGSITAKLTNLVGDDVCEGQLTIFSSDGLQVTSDTYQTAGVYRAKVVDLRGDDAENYTINPDLSMMTYDFSVKSVSPNAEPVTPPSSIPPTGDNASAYPILLAFMSLTASYCVVYLKKKKARLSDKQL